METVGSTVSAISVIESVAVLAAASVTLATILFVFSASVTASDQVSVPVAVANVVPPSTETSTSAMLDAAGVSAAVPLIVVKVVSSISPSE